MILQQCKGDIDMTVDTNSAQQKRYAWLTLVLIFAVFGSGIFSLDVMPPLFLEISSDFTMTNTEMGATISAFHLASPIFTPIGGLLVDRYGPRRVLTFALILLSIASFGRSMADSALQLSVVMFFMGVGFASFGPNVPKVLGAVFPQEQLARVNGLVFSGVGLANALALGMASTVLLPTLGSWQAVMQFTAAITLLLAVLWFSHMRKFNTFGNFAQNLSVVESVESGGQTVKEIVKHIIKVKDLWGVAIFFAMPAFGYWGLLSQLPPVLGQRGIEEPGLMVATMTGTSVFANILGGYISDKLGRRKIVLMVCAIGLGVTLPLAILVEGPAIYVVMVLSGLFFGPIVPIALTIPVELPEIGTKYAGSALGFVFMIGNLGSILGPLCLGYLLDVTGSPATSFSVAALLLVLSVFPLTFVRETANRAPAKR